MRANKKTHLDDNHITEIPENPKPNFTNVALGTFKDTVSGEWYVAEVQYDPQTLVTTPVNAIPAGNDRALAEEKFKLLVIEKKIF